MDCAIPHESGLMIIYLFILFIIVMQNLEKKGPIVAMFSFLQL